MAARPDTFFRRARPSSYKATNTERSLSAARGSSRLGPEYLLLPVNTWFIWATLVVALFLNMLPYGRMAWVPDVLAVVLVFWNVHQPRRVGVGAAFLFGLVMDVHSGALLGQTALAYTALSFFAIMIHRRMLWFSLGAQSMHVLPLFIAAQLLILGVRMATNGQWPGWSFLAAPFLETLLWPLVSVLLLAPQRRPVNGDKNRPVL